MHREMEDIFRLREEYDLEIDLDVKTGLNWKLHEKLDEFLQRHRLRMSHGTFLRATREDYKNWRRNPH